jgi:hypothetical protein
MAARDLTVSCMHIAPVFPSVTGLSIVPAGSGIVILPNAAHGVQGASGEKGVSFITRGNKAM